MCGCYYGWAAPTCLEAASPEPVCDPQLNASDVPPACTYCDPTQPLGEQGCYNGGTCYYKTGSGAAPPGRLTCGCGYDYSGPQCYQNATRLRLCDPHNSTDKPPLCEYCYIDAPVGNNGCANQGFCQLQAGSAPNSEVAICKCQAGYVPPQCTVNTFAAFGRPDLIVYRWCFFAGELAIGILAVLVMAQHFYHSYHYKFTPANKIKAFGAFIVFMSALMGMLYYGINPGGWVFGYPSSYTVIQQTMLVFSLVQFTQVAIAINTSNWIWIGLAAVSPSRKADAGWPVISYVITWTTTIVLTVLNIFLSCYQTVNPSYRSVFFYVASGFGILWCLFSCVSGAVIMATIKSIEHRDPRLLFRTASQLVLLCSVELVASVLLIVVIALPSTVYTSAVALFGISFIFTSLVLYLLQIALLIQFRIAVWQLKEVALPRVNTIASGTNSVRKKANSYTDSMSKGMSCNSTDGSEMSQMATKSAPAAAEVTQPTLDQGFVTL